MGFKFNAARDDAEEKMKIGLHNHNATIDKVSVSAVKKGVNEGAPMINLRWKIVDGVDAEKTIFDKLMFIVDDKGYCVQRIEQFMKAIGKDASEEWGDTELTIPFLTDYVEQLLGEVATINLGMGKASKGDDGTEYAPRIEVKKYAPYGAVKNANDLVDLD